MPDHAPSPTRTKARGRIAWADTARALAMIWIVGFWHGLGYCPHFLNQLQNLVPIHVLSGVTTGVLGTFMFLSSHLILLQRRFLNGKDVVSFYHSRAIRILPLFFLSLASIPFVGFDKHGVAVRFWAFIGLSQYIPGFGILTLWFVSVLLSFYLLLPVLATERLSACCRMAIGLSCLTVLLSLSEWAGSDPRIPVCFAAFLLGCWASRIAKVWESSAAAVMVSVVWFYLLWLPEETLLREILLSSFGIFPMRLLSSVLSRIPFLAGPWRFFAYVSFAAYLFHRQIYKTFFHFLPPEGPFRPLLLVCVGFPLVIASSFVLQRLGDEVARRLRIPRHSPPS